jgi:N-acetylmuramoyl-L-alanine amidase
MNKLEYLVIHCTATEHGREVTPQEIKNWHTLPKPKGNGWKKVGYTDMIDLKGKLHNLHPFNSDEYVDPWEVTNGASGYNGVSRHIVYVGGLLNGKSADTRTKEQIEALMTYCKYMVLRYPDIKICGHGDFPNTNKTCPNFNVLEFLQHFGLDGSYIHHER